MADPGFNRGGHQVLLLPPANVVCECYVFTGVCLSTGGGGSPSRGVLHPRGVLHLGGVLHPRGVLHPEGGFSIQGGFSMPGGLHPVNVRAVRILLECILVLQKCCRKLYENERILTEDGVLTPLGSFTALSYILF